MDPVLLRAWLPLSPDAVEAGLAERVTASHLFLPSAWLVAGGDVVVGARVVVEVDGNGLDGLRCFGVVAWCYREHDVPAGREAGVGVLIGDVDDDDSRQLLARLSRLRGAGSRVRVPGQRVAARLKLGDDGVVGVPVTAMAPAWNVSPLPSLPTSRLVGLLADRALGDSQPDGVVADSGIRASAALAEREAMLARALRDTGSLDTLDGDDPTVASPEPSVGVPRFDVEARTTSGVVERPFASMLLDVGGFDAFPDAPPLPLDEPGARRPFEAQSTDVDLLGEISAADVIALERVAERQAAEAAAGNTDDDDDDVVDLASLPSVEAELLDGWEDDTPEGGEHALAAQPTELLTRRSLPDNVAWPSSFDDDEPEIAGMAWSVSRRGQTGIETFAWPAVGSKRYGGQGDAFELDTGDADVFSPPPPPPMLAPPDPFAAQVTDPRLNVEGLVARHVRASHTDVFADDDVDIDGHAALFGDDPDATSDELPLPRLLSETPAQGLLRAPPHGAPLDRSIVDDDDRSASSSGEGNPI